MNNPYIKQVKVATLAYAAQLVAVYLETHFGTFVNARAAAHRVNKEGPFYFHISQSIQAKSAVGV